MDPALGDCVDLALDQFEALWCDLENGAILIGTAQDKGPSAVR